MEHLNIDGALIEYQVHGNGEPVLLIPMSIFADSLGGPLLAQPELASHYQLIHYHRREYMGSSLGPEPLTVERQARDAAALLRYLQVKSAHVVGDSYGGSIALQLALDAPELVHTLALLEPSIGIIPRGGVSWLLRLFPALNKLSPDARWRIVSKMIDRAEGSGWQAIVEHSIPGGVGQAKKDAGTYVREVPFVPQWQFGSRQAAVIRQPVLSMMGIHSPALMMKERKLLHDWFPQTEDYDVQSNHLLQLQDPAGVAHGLAEFFSRHPLT